MQAPPSAERLAAAKRVANEARRGLPQLAGPQRVSHENPNFLSEFFGASRLHLIGSWKERFQRLLDSLPEAPPLPAPTRGTPRYVAHIDMDCFFASIALRGRPELEGIAVAIAWAANEGGSAEIASCSYEARAHGVRNGMWTTRAKELCEHLVVMPYEFDKYVKASEDMHRAVFDATPHVMGVSVDECFADLTEAAASSAGGDAAAGIDAVVSKLRAAIFRRTGCTASVGVGPNRLIARLATKVAKPNGYVRFGKDEGVHALRELPVKDALPSVGHSTAAKLAAIGVHTCADVLAADASRLNKALGPKVSANVRALAGGDDPRPWEARPVRKTVGAQSSWGVRFASASDAHDFASKLAHEVGSRLASQGLRGQRVELKIWRAVDGAPDSARKGSMGHGICDQFSRSLTLPAPTNDGTLLAAEAKKMLTELRVEATALRGMGVSVGLLGGANAAKPAAGGKAKSGGGRALPAQVARAPPPKQYSADMARIPCAVCGRRRQADEAEPDTLLRLVDATTDDEPQAESAVPAIDANRAAEEAMKDSIRFAYVCGVLPVADAHAAACAPADVLSLMTQGTVRAAGACCRAAATDGAHDLVRFARELAMSSMVHAASDDGRRLGLSSSSFVRWLDAADRAEPGAAL